MKDCSPSISPIMKGDKLNLSQCPKNDFMWEHMKNIPYASSVGSLMYAQVCTILDITYVVGVLGRYKSNLGERITCSCIDGLILEVIAYSNLDYVGCIDSQKSTSGYIFMLASGAVSWRTAKHLHYGS
ncbi:hypothetical protein CR513_60547, partial [Mucuna pruriens]